MNIHQRLFASYSTGGGGGGGSDPNFANVVSLLHFNGADASTTFTDVIGKTWTANASAQIDTAQSKFGGASGLFSGADHIDTPDSDDFYLDGDFTLELWFRPTSIGSRNFLTGQGNVGASDVRSLLEMTDTGTVKFFANSSITLTTTAALSAATWAHLAVTRAGSNYTIWIDGVSRATLTDATIPSNFAGVFCIGRCGLFNGLYANGHIDDFRLTKGVARYTGTFSPPAAQFPDS